MPGPFQPLYFEKEEVILDIPMQGVTVDAWTIIPLTNPVVSFKIIITKSDILLGLQDTQSMTCMHITSSL